MNSCRTYRCQRQSGRVFDSARCVPHPSSPDGYNLSMKLRGQKIIKMATALSLMIAAMLLVIVLISIFGRVDFEIQYWPQGRRDGTASQTFALVAMRTAALLDHQEFAAAGHEAEVEPGVMVHIPLTRC